MATERWASRLCVLNRRFVRSGQEVARLETRNAYLEGELKLQERHHTNTLKEVITLKQQLAKKKPAKRR
jgi:hypothetical protein